MKTPDGLTVTPTSYQDVVALLKSDALSAVEKPIASRCHLKINYDDGSASTSYTQAEISVCGMTTDQLAKYMNDHVESLIDFGVRFLNADNATSEEQEPKGSQEPDGESETVSYGNGFGIKIAIYHSFLANRTLPDFRAYLKNRRIPAHTKFAKELSLLFAESRAACP